MAKLNSGTVVQSTYKEGVLTLFGRFTSTGAAGAQAIITEDGQSKGLVSLTADAGAGEYTLTIASDIKAQILLGSPSISYIKNSTASPAAPNDVVRIPRVLSTSGFGGSGPATIRFIAQDAAGAAKYFPGPDAGPPAVPSVIAVSVVLSTSSVF